MMQERFNEFMDSYILSRGLLDTDDWVIDAWKSASEMKALDGSCVPVMDSRHPLSFFTR
jgi:hypothetical protein